MSRRDLWRKLHERFDPELPTPMEWRAELALKGAKTVMGSLFEGQGLYSEAEALLNQCLPRRRRRGSLGRRDRGRDLRFLLAEEP
ncbi:MAG TPA: hypothetical protein VF664_19745, partial [Cystobacter sp.]